MLILPLHRALTRRTLPFVTVFLVIVNVMVFAFAQRGDTQRLGELRSWYVDSGLAEQEWPHYLRYLEQSAGDEAAADARQWPPERRGDRLFYQRLMDAGLDAALSAAAGLDESVPAADSAIDSTQELTQLQRHFDVRLGGVTTYRYLLRHSEIDPVRMVSHAFLHGGLMHLVGNMLFLIALGLLVEGPLGEWRFGALYLVGILGSALFSLTWRWGEPGGGLGASGAIAALMGAFCVIWGRRPVRFFWWFFVAFGYIKKPAIWLLPAWIGWEAFNLIFNANAGIGFDAHLGGLLTGALVAWVLVRTGRLRETFFEEQSPADDLVSGLEQARQALGRMDLEQAEAQLAELSERHSMNLEVILLRQRTATLGNDPLQARALALAALAIPATTATEVASQLALLEACLPLTEPVPKGTWRTLLRQRWLALGHYDQVECLLERWLADEAGATTWFELALARRDAGNMPSFRGTLERIVAHYPDAPEAGKARFLLEQGGVTDA